MNPYESPAAVKTATPMLFASQRVIRAIALAGIGFWLVMLASGLTKIFQLRNEAIDFAHQLAEEGLIYEDPHVLRRWVEAPGALPITFVSIFMSMAGVHLFRTNGHGILPLAIAYLGLLFFHLLNFYSNFWFDIFAGFLPPEEHVYCTALRPNYGFALLMTGMFYILAAAHVVLLYRRSKPLALHETVTPIPSPIRSKQPPSFFFAIIFLLIAVALALLQR